MLSAKSLAHILPVAQSGRLFTGEDCLSNQTHKGAISVLNYINRTMVHLYVSWQKIALPSSVNWTRADDSKQNRGNKENNENMSLVTRKPVFGVYDQVRLKPACAATEAS